MSSIQEIIEAMRDEVEMAMRAKEAIDKRFSPEERAKEAAEVDAQLRQELATFRERGDELVDRQRKAADVELAQARAKRRPQGAAGWSEASARRTFVKDDVEAMEPAEISKAYELAQAAGDKVEAWLIGRAGLARFDALAQVTVASSDPRGIDAKMTNARLAEKFREQVHGQAQRKYRERIHDLDQLAYALHTPCHEWEEQQQTQAVAQRYGIKQYGQEPAVADAQ